jgi:ubiquinone/menaquinone biosynthesis C-methylase UbiE
MRKRGVIQIEKISEEWLDPKRVRNYVSSMRRIYWLNYRNFAAEVIDYIDKDYNGHKATLLDLGCGPAFFSIEIKRKRPQYHVMADDPSPVMLEIARNEASSKGVNDISFEEGHDGCIPMEDGAADVVVSQFNLYLWEDIDAGLREVRRVLKQGGLFIGRDQDGDSPYWKVMIFYGMLLMIGGPRLAGPLSRFKSEFYEKWRTHGEVADALGRANFRVEIVEKGKLGKGLAYTVIARKDSDWLD